MRYRTSNCTLHWFPAMASGSTQNTSEDFFNALFGDNIYMIMAEETKKYAHRKKQTPKYKRLLFLHLK